MNCQSEDGRCCYCYADGKESTWMGVYEGITCHCYKICQRERPEYFQLRDEERLYLALAEQKEAPDEPK